jgi:hypothetical protein
MLMRSLNSAVRWGTILVAVAVFNILPYSLAAQTHPAPGITITEVPPSASGGPDQMFPISGEVNGVEPKDYRVVIYVLAGGTWFVQPFDYAPLTEIKTGGKWETETHGGSIYAALLVRPNYKPKAQLNALPDAAGDIVARVRVAGTSR